MSLEKLNKQLQEIKKDLEAKFKKAGLSDEQIQLKMNSLDTEFIIHTFVNGQFISDSSTEERLEFYIRFLDIKLEE